ncbi:MAG: sulfatase-like hydrolase/transferase [Acholeplasmataceae bacterium]|nr:sulfatase-like hydrolase/transferase [Acholeplasmataceae bacterium]
MTKEHKLLWTFIILFYLLNIFSTFFVTTEIFNQYIIVFPRSFWHEVNAFVGNIAVLTIILFVGFLIFKKTKSRLIFIIAVTAGLNLGVFLLGIFTKYYQTMLSLRETTLFKNPAQKLAFNIFVESIKELFTYLRIFIFLPTVVLTTNYFFIKRFYFKNKLDFKAKMTLFGFVPLNSMLILTGFVASLFTLSVFNISMNTTWPIFAERPLYGVQTAGLYNYYFGQAMGFEFQDNKIIELDTRVYAKYNKNAAQYENFFGEYYSNRLHLDDANISYLDSSISQIELNGIFKDKNLVLVHLESFNHFLLDEDGPYLDSDYYKTLKAILEESYILDNFYTNVGLGNSSDAEFTLMTGLYPTGDTTLNWKYKDDNYQFETLPKLFSDRYNVSFHGDVAKFYNRLIVHEEMFGFEKHYYFDPNEDLFEDSQNGYWLFPENNKTNTPQSPWLCELELLEWLRAIYERKGDKKAFLFPIMIQPHTPYNYNPVEEEDLRFSANDINISMVALRYLNYEAYIEMFFKRFIEVTKELENTVYIFYGDHGSGLNQSDLETILGPNNTVISNGNGKVNQLKYRAEMLRTVAFIYAPDDTDNISEGPQRGLLKGVQQNVRSQVDLYRTIIELFGLETENYYYGVNALSKEHTFAIDTRTFTIMTDDYYIIGKKLAKDGEINEKSVYFYNEDYFKDPLELFEYVFNYKAHSDRALMNNAYYYLKN